MTRVLVVDDDAQVRGFMRQVLARLGHVVWEASDGTDALRILESVPLDLVITDAYMPAVDGVELLVRIQQRGLHIPLVMVSGGGYRSREDVLAMATRCGAVATLEKPFSAEQLRATIEPLVTVQAPSRPGP